MRKIIATTAIIISIFTCSSAEAALAITSPATVCALLNNEGLTTEGWRDASESEYGCNSSYKEIGTGFPLGNNLAYYVDGRKNLVVQAKLVLNVNDKSQATAAHSVLLGSSGVLSAKLGGVKLPQSLNDAIANGKSISATAGQATVKVMRKNWPNGNGYELHVIFK